MKTASFVSVIVLMLFAQLTLCEAEGQSDPGLWSGAPGPFFTTLTTSTQPLVEIDDDCPGETRIFDAVRAGRPDSGPEHSNTVKAATVRSAAAILAAFDAPGRNNALIQLEPIGAKNPAWPLPAGSEIAVWWNRGEHERALLALEQLEAEGARFAPAISWREPIVSTKGRWNWDVRIGGSRTGADDVILDFDPETGNIFAAVSWTDGWSVNISTDQGASWQETYWYTSGAAKIGMVVVGDHAWVAYSPNGDPGEARMRRFFATTGAVDDPYWYHLIDDVSPSSIVDMELGANTDDWDDRVFPIFITNAGDLHFYWSTLDGTSFSEMSPPVGNADDGLDYTWNTHDPTDYPLFLSYLSTGDSVVVWRADASGTWEQVITTGFTGIHRRTGISAHTGTVMVIHEHLYTEGTGVRYQVSYNGGGGWNGGSLYVPGVGDPSAWSPDISLRSGLGSVAIFNREEGAFDVAYVTLRRGYSSGGWSDPLGFNDYDLVSGSPNQIDWIGTSCVSTYGVVYMGEDYIPYFDLMTPRGFFCDGFESGNTSVWD